AREFLKQNDLDDEDEILIRREIAANGKSRAFINDTPATLTQLRQLSSLLVDLHQQFDTLELNNNDFQREVIDALAGNKKNLQEYQLAYKKYREAQKELEQLTNEQAAANKEFDYHQFLFDELHNADFTEDEIERIDAELKLMSNAENIKSVLSDVYFQLEEKEDPLVQQVKSIHHKLQSLEKYYPELGSLNSRLYSVEVELKDIADEADAINNKVNYDAEKINELNDRMAAGYSLLKKHNVLTTAQLLEIKDNLEKELLKVTNLTEAIEKKQIQSEKYYREALKIA